MTGAEIGIPGKCPGITLLSIRYLADLWWSSMTLQWSDPHFPGRRFLSISCWGHPSQELGTHGIHGMELSVIRCHEILARKNTTRRLCLEWPNPTLARIGGAVQVWPAKIEVIRVSRLDSRTRNFQPRAKHRRGSLSCVKEKIRFAFHKHQIKNYTGWIYDWMCSPWGLRS